MAQRNQQPPVEKNEIRHKAYPSEKELKNREELLALMGQSPIPKREVLANLGLFVNRQTLTRYLFLNELYQKVLDVHGIVAEFGVRWGQNLALMESLRGIYEPYNYNRQLVGFDTWEGFPSVHGKDGGSDIAVKGAYAVTKGYEEYLAKVLDCHEQESPVSHIQKYQLVKGDATVTVPKYLKENPQTIIAFAYFDFDIYEPTKKVLEAIKPYLTKGSIIGFDELNKHDFPGETVAVREVFGLGKYKITRSRYSAMQSYLVIE
jgi:hypothetical protein